MNRHRLLVLFILAATALAFAAKPSLEFRDTTWTFTNVPVKLSVKIQGFGSGSDVAATSMMVAIDASCPTFTLNWDGDDVMTGDVFRKSPSDPKLVLGPDPTSLQPFFDVLNAAVEEAGADVGLTWVSDFDTLDKQKLQMPVKVDTKNMLATPSISLGLSVSGTISGDEIPGVVPVVISFKAKGKGDSNPLTDIL